ncbi:DUF389 domain-containing protein [Selenomonas sp. WCA-380-WT-3B 3/]|uniref:DUF389 domain-containing protein n=2 Tax=Selenomonas TaxID=970 RepID=A0A6I2V1Q9_9FIRM|nr:DUF389 domain-containing protein [Selenomonas montiformis]MSV25392.1 DUF389 domain-containing protein [Selenomonas montiformis]
MMWRDLFNLKGGAASIQEINQRILADATVSGTNLIVLVMAIMIACVGLNMNSVAVIIGAMLISPLMGGIVAIGYGMATYDVHFIRQSMIKLAFQVGFAILTASLYFAISPLAYSTDELLARTSPTIWDVIVALCGGIAGAVGNTRQEKSNVIPGVAIATALMPPLCTAGYGLASGHYPFFLGAMYLFFINAFFIALAAFLVFKVLGVPSHGDVAASQFQRQRIILAALGILITAPSIYLAYQMVEENLRDMQVKSFISEDMDFQTTSVVSYTVKDHVLTVDLVGTLLTEKEIDALQDELHARNRLQDLELVVIQGQRELDREQVQNLINARLEKQNSSEKKVSYKNLSAQYYPAYKRASADQQTIELLTQQAPLLFPEVLSIQGGTLTSVTPQKDQSKTENKVDHKRFMVEVIVKEPLRPEEADRLQKWIAAQVDMPVLMTVQTADHPSDFYGDGIAWP